MSNVVSRVLVPSAIMLVLVLGQGCATKITRPDDTPQPTSVRLGTFDAVAMKHVETASKFASSSANQKAARKIDELLFNKMKMVFPELKTAGTAAVQRGLVIEPRIEEIKFIGGAARFWVGAMAGSSAVLMKVVFRDASTREILGSPRFYRVANAFAGGISVGGTDNAMLEAIAMDVVEYARLNR